MCLKVIVLRQDPCPHQLLLQNRHKIQKADRPSSADVIDRIRRQREAVLTVFLLRSALHHTHNSFHNIIHIGEIAAAVSVIEDLYGLSGTELIGKTEVCHIRSSGRAVHGKEAKARGGNVVQLRIRMRHQLIGLLRCRIQGDRIIHLILRGERHLPVGSIDRGGRGIDKVLHAVAAVTGMAAGLQNVVEADEVGLDVGIRICNGIPDPCLRGKIYHKLRLLLSKQLLHRLCVRNVPANKFPPALILLRRSADLRQSPVLDGRIIIVVQIIDSDNPAHLVVL